MATRYDVVVLGDGALAAGVAWALATASGGSGRRIAVLAPRLLGSGCHPDDLARLNALRAPAGTGTLVTRAAVRYRAWAEALGLEPPRVRGGHVAMATTVEWRRRLVDAAASVPACRPIDEAERAELVAGHDHRHCLASWHEPLATSMEVATLVFRLAEQAARAAVDLVDGATVQQIARLDEGYRLGTTAGVTDATVVIDVDASLPVARAAGLRGFGWAATHQHLRTEAMAPLLGSAITIDDVRVSQRPTGEIDLVVPVDEPVVGAGIAAAARAAGSVLAALPLFAAAPIVGRRTHHEVLTDDGAPVVGEVAEGMWACGGFGVHHLDVLPLVAEALAGAVLHGTLDPDLARFAPRVRPGATDGDLPRQARVTCPTCGPRRRDQFALVGGRVVHRQGCGRALPPLRRAPSHVVLGAAVAAAAPASAAGGPTGPSIERRAVPEPVAAVDPSSTSSMTGARRTGVATPPRVLPAAPAAQVAVEDGQPAVAAHGGSFSFGQVTARSGWTPPRAIDDLPVASAGVVLAADTGLGR